MSALDFLFQGQAPQSTTQYGQTSSGVPGWLQDYTQGLLAQSAALASQPYQTYQGPRIAGFTPAQQQAQQRVQDLQGGYLPALQSAQGMAQGAANPALLQQAGGYLPQAQSYISGAMNPTAATMNPYVENVINRGTQLAMRNFNENVMPGLDQRYTAAGQFGSSANQREADRAARDLTEGINAQDKSALSQAFQNAQQTGLQAASQTGALAQLGGGLGYEQGVLGLQGAGTMANLGQLGQNLGFQGAGALDTVGQQQQQQQQQNLNLGYQDFLNQQQWPYQQAGWLSQMMSGTATPTTVPRVGQTSQTGYAPSYTQSPIEQTIGMYSAMNPPPSARGGPIRRRSALEFLRRAA